MTSAEIDFTALYSRHLDFVWRNLRALGVSASDLEDAAQDTFVVAYRRRRDFRPEASMRAWLYGIARRVAYRQRRGGGRRARLAEAVSSEPCERPSLEQIAEDRQAWAIAMAALDGLPATQREAYWLTEVKGLTAAQAGEAVGVSGNTISSRLRAARQSLARHGEVMRARDAGALERSLRRGAGPSPRERRQAVAALALHATTLSKAAAPLLGGLTLWVGAGAAAAALVVGVLVVMPDDPAPPSSAATPTEASSSTETRASTPAPPVSRSERVTEVPVLAAPLAAAASSPEPSKRRPKPTTTPSTLADETKLVRRIKASLAREPKQALALADDHDRRFPDGVLRHETAALRVQALCHLGADTRAGEAAKALPSGHAWSAGCRRAPQQKATNTTTFGEEQGK